MSQHFLMHRRISFYFRSSQTYTANQKCSSPIQSLKLRAWLSCHCARDFLKGVRSLNEQAVGLVNWSALNRQRLFLSFGFRQEIRLVRAVNSYFRLTFQFGLIFPRVTENSRAFAFRARYPFPRIGTTWNNFFSLTESRRRLMFSLIFWPQARD